MTLSKATKWSYYIGYNSDYGGYLWRLWRDKTPAELKAQGPVDGQKIFATICLSGFNQDYSASWEQLRCQMIKNGCINLLPQD